MRRAVIASPYAIGLLLCGCGAPEPPPSTGGTDIEAGPCGRGLVVISTDYQSTNVSLLAYDGEVLSSSFVSSASANAALSAPLSGDVVAPGQLIAGDDVVLLDRFPASVLTWIDVESADVRAQLDVRTGFAANPQDYLPISASKAYVSRFETNPTPGQQMYDAGGDLLIIDPTAPAITGRVDLTPAMADAPGFLPRANRMALVGDRAFVVLSAYDPSFTASAPSRIVAIDHSTDSIVDTLIIDGMHGCSTIASRGDELAVACTGTFDANGEPVVAESGVLIIEDMVETRRAMASDITGRAVGFGLAFAGDDVVVTTLGAFGVATDALVTVDGEELYRSAERPFELGDVRCCGSACFLADAETAQVRRFDVNDGEITPISAVTVDTDIGLPPRGLGRF